MKFRAGVIGAAVATGALLSVGSAAQPAGARAERPRLVLRDLGRATKIYNDMLADKDCTVCLVIAGSTSAGGCMDLYAELVRNNMVDVIVATGAVERMPALEIADDALVLGARTYLTEEPTLPTGRILVIPQGTRIIGQYDNSVQYGQSRVLLVWNRLILPNGRSIVLERQPGADTQGYAGLEDGVDYHWWDLAKAAGLSTLLSVGSELAIDDQDRLLRAIRNGGQDTINDAGQQIVRRQLNVAPTLTIRPGFPVRVIVTRDLVLEPYRG